MLEDRNYMRPDWRSGGSWISSIPVSIWLMISLVVAFALQQIDIVYLQARYLDDLVLSSECLTRGHVWQLLTFQFLHGGLLHLFCNLIGIWFFARFVEERIGRARFLLLYFGSGIAGGLFFAILATLFPLHFGAALGASAGISGIFAAYTVMEPDAVILAYFLVPIRAKYLFYAYVGISLFFTVVPTTGVAYAAHLGGMAFGAAYARWGMNPYQNWAEWNPFRRKQRREQMMRAASVPPPRARRRPNPQETQELPSEEFISKQVDPILDKISAHGIQSLTDRERQILQAARAKMAKR